MSDIITQKSKATGKIVSKMGTKKPVEIEIATTQKDVDIYSGWATLLNPDPVLAFESGGKGIKLYDEISRDPHAASVLQTRILSVVGKEWSIVPAVSGAISGERDVEIASFVEEALCNCNFDQMRMEILQAILYGYYGSEIIWKASNGSWTVDRFIGKHPRRFCFTIEREPRLITPESMIDGEPLPDKKFLIYQYGDSDNPYGRGIGQQVWWYTWFKKNGIKFWVKFMERFGSPTTLGKYPQQAKEQRAKLLDAIDAIQNESGIVIPDNMSLELLEASRTGDGTYLAACEYFDKQISKAFLGQTLTTEVGNTGSYAASKTHGDVRQDITEADADLIDSYLNKTLITWIVDYNFPGVIDYPKLLTNAGAKPDLLSRKDIDKALAVDVGLPISKSYFYSTYGIPEPDQSEELVDVPVKGGSVPVFAEGGVAKIATDQVNQVPVDHTVTKAQKRIDELTDVSILRGRPVVGQMLSTVRRLADKSDSLGDLKQRIFNEYEHMSTEDLEKLLFESMMVANLQGRALNNIVAAGHAPIPGNSVVNMANIQQLSGLTPDAYLTAADAAIGQPSDFFFWGPYGTLSELPIQAHGQVRRDLRFQALLRQRIAYSSAWNSRFVILSAIIESPQAVPRA